MRQLRRSAVLSGPVLLAVLSTVACSRRINVPAEVAADDSRTPFRAAGANDAAPGTGSASRTNASNANQERSLPFRDSTGIPAGTLLMVRLQTPIAVGVPIANDSFEAIIDQAIVIDGNTFIPRGTSVGGRVESVFISQVEPRRGYVRLGLESLHLGATDVHLQTTSLFARQTSANDQSSSTIRLEKGRRLTFRLTEPVSVSPQPTQASR